MTRRKHEGEVDAWAWTKEPASFIDPEVSAAIDRKRKGDDARTHARQVLKGEGPALGLDPIALAEVHEGLAAELRAMARAARVGDK